MKTGKGKSEHFGGLRSPMARAEHGLIKKGSLKPAIASNTIRKDIGTGAANVRSAQTAGQVIKPW